MRGAVGVEVVEHAPRLVLLDVEPGEPHHPTVVVPGVDDLGLDLHGRAVHVGRDGELADVVPELVEPVDAGGHAPPLAGVERLGVGELGPQRVVALDDAVADEDRVDVVVEHLPGLEVHELADDVRPRDLEVVPALAVGERGVDLARLRVHEVGGEGAGVSAEEGVREGDVAPVEAEQVQSHEKHGERVDEARRGVRAQVLAEQGAVGQRELQVLGDEDGVELLALGCRAPRDDGERLDGRRAHPAQRPELLVLVVRDALADLLDGDDPTGELDEPHDVAGDASGQCCEDGGRPLLEGDLPRQVEQRGIEARRGDLQGLGHRQCAFRGV